MLLEAAPTVALMSSIMQLTAFSIRDVTSSPGAGYMIAGKAQGDDPKSFCLDDVEQLLLLIASVARPQALICYFSGLNFALQLPLIHIVQ